MNTATSASAPVPGPSTFTRAPKGKACLSCRRRKMKCDCVRPVCGQCVRFNRERDCEYTDGDQRSRTEILEEQIAQLQARINTLESTAEPVMQPVSIPSVAPRGAFLDSPNDFSLSFARVSGAPQFTDIGHNQDALVEAFLTYSEDLAFFLNVHRFVNYVQVELASSQDFTHDPLLNATFLWGSVLSNEHYNEPLYLSRVLQYLPKAYEERPLNCLHILQTEILLANYFFYAGKFVEARKHLSSAVSIVLTYKMHKIRSAHEYLSRMLELTDLESSLPHSSDSIEEGEKIYGFWWVYILDKSWSTALNVESLLVEDGSPATRIEVPWPLAPELLQSGQFSDDYRGSRTIQRFLNEPILHSIPAVLSTHALRAQATALLDRAKWLSSTCSADPALLNIHQHAFNMLDSQIEDFILSLPTLDILRIYSPPQTRSLVTTHMVARMAIMQLHIAFADSEVTAAVKCLSASKAIIAAFKVLYLDHPELPGDFTLHAEPFVLILLTASARIMIIEDNKYIQQRALWQNMALCASTGYMRTVLKELIEQMAKVNAKSRLTVMQVRKANDSRMEPFHFLTPVPSH